jgi:hypothetical protein
MDSALTSEFDDFLFAPIGEDRNGMPLSVLSALARQDLNAWQEAAELARLPTDCAIQRMASIIVAQSDGQSVCADSGATAARLIGLLRPRHSSKIPQRQMPLGAGAVPPPRLGIYVVLFVISLGVMFNALSNIVNRNAAAQAGNLHAPALTTDPPQVPQANINPGR